MVKMCTSRQRPRRSQQLPLPRLRISDWAPSIKSHERRCPNSFQTRLVSALRHNKSNRGRRAWLGAGTEAWKAQNVRRDKNRATLQKAFVCLGACRCVGAWLVGLRTSLVSGRHLGWVATIGVPRRGAVNAPWVWPHGLGALRMHKNTEVGAGCFLRGYRGERVGKTGQKDGR
jgi:hypothetical protein